MPLTDAQGKVPGRLMGVAIGPPPADYHDLPDNFISCETNAELFIDKQFIPSSSPVDGKYESNVPSKRNWYMSVDGYLLRRAMGADFKTLYDAWYDDELLTVRFRTRPQVDQYLSFTGTVWVQGGSLMAPARGMSTWNIQLRGDGVLDKEWEEFWAIINAMPPTADWPTIVEMDPDNWQS